MNDSQRLLAEYAVRNSESAFQELVRRYVGLVYGAALRLVDGDTHLAEDIAQVVFADLARQAGTLPSGVQLGGWLHRHTCFVAATARRRERRRQARERQAVEMNASQNQSDPSLAALGPMLDEVINRLGEKDRAAILLRFFEQRDFRHVGEVLGTSEDAARVRVNRALEKLRVLLQRRGVALSAAALSTALASESLTAAPAGLALVISGAALTGLAVGSGSTLAVATIMTISKFKICVVAALVCAGITVPLVVQHRAELRLRQQNEVSERQQAQLTQLTVENARLAGLLAQARTKPAPRLPAPTIQPISAPVPVEDLDRTNLISRALQGEWPKLSREQIDAYLNANRRSAGSLLAVFRAMDDAAFLKEAEAKYPNDPRVAFAAALKSDSAAERRQWLEQFKHSAPDNALANYLSALDYFKAGQTDQAVQELTAAPNKPQLQDYSWDFIQNAEEAWRTAGYSEAETRMVATWQLLLPHIAEFQNLNQDIMSVANAYKNAGDEASARAMLQLNLNLGQRLEEAVNAPLLTQLVGIAIQRNTLAAMDPASPYDEGGQTVGERLQQLDQEKTNIHNLVKQINPLQQTMTPQDWINYTDRTRTFGEVNAIEWLLNKYSQR